MAVLLPEEQVEDKSAYGDKNQDDNPSEAFYGIAVFEDDNDDREDNREDKTRVNPKIQPVAPRVGVCSEHGFLLYWCAICAKVYIFLRNGCRNIDFFAIRFSNPWVVCAHGVWVTFRWFGCYWLCIKVII